MKKKEMCCESFVFSLLSASDSCMSLTSNWFFFAWTWRSSLSVLPTLTLRLLMSIMCCRNEASKYFTLFFDFLLLQFHLYIEKHWHSFSDKTVTDTIIRCPQMRERAGSYSIFMLGRFVMTLNKKNSKHQIKKSNVTAQMPDTCVKMAISKIHF